MIQVSVFFGDMGFKKGLVTKEQLAKMYFEEKLHLIFFIPQFSTLEALTEISGRGIGMDVAKTNLEKMGAHIRVETQVGLGTVFVILVNQ